MSAYSVANELVEFYNADVVLEHGNDIIVYLNDWDDHN